MAVRTTIEVIGAKQNNLKNVSVEIPRDKLTVITGVSGSGKSSLAFDVIYGEGQRRFLDSLSTFSKSRINHLKKAKVDYVRGLSPVIAIEQKKGSNNPRSTIGTMTDINDYLRLLFATVGTGACPVCGHPLKQLSAAQMAEHISALPDGTVIELRAPIYRIYNEDYPYLFKIVRDKGYKNILVNGEPMRLSDKLELDEEEEYQLEIVIDRFTIKSDIYIQIAKSIEAAMAALDEDIIIRVEVIDGAPASFYQNFGCPEHHMALCQLQPFHFSFNSTASACHTCGGVGMSYVVEPRFLVVAPHKSLNKGAIKSTLYNPASRDSYRSVMMYSISHKYDFSLDTPWNELPKRVHDLLLYGSKGEKVDMVQPPFAKKRNWIVGRSFVWGGYVKQLQKWYQGYIRKSADGESFEPGFIKETMVENICPECNGARLKRQRLSILVGGKNIDELSRMQLPILTDFLHSLTFDADNADVASSIAREITSRVQLLVDIGLHYLNLGRRSDTISGGEAQRIRMSTQISSELMGMLYVMDEPSIGLHARDAVLVINTMKKLRDIGNTLIVVEHDMETIKSADFVVEVGPGPGLHGGEIVAAGRIGDIVAADRSVTGRYLSGDVSIPIPTRRRKPTDNQITIQGARENNLKNITVEIPLGLFVCVTGVSGSGKSTLINETLCKQLDITLNSARIVAGKHDHIFGYTEINNVINIDQSPIGRSSKSNPATYIGLYDRIRDLYAATPDAQAKGYRALDFSLTHANGTRCDHCSGDGIITTSLQFMADIETLCPVCKGARFSEEGLEVRYNGKNIAEVLEMTTEEALDFFGDNTYLKHKLSIMNELGLGYLTLGQSSSTLSGGEAQRIKLAFELAKIKRGSHNIYILDEPTTGLHLSDIQKLLDCLNKLVDKGHTVLVIEHHLDVIKCADHVIDMGPEGGDAGGYVVATGAPEDIVTNDKSYTGKYLRELLSANCAVAGV